MGTLLDQSTSPRRSVLCLTKTELLSIPSQRFRMTLLPKPDAAIDARLSYRRGLVAPTSGVAPGFTQCNMISLPKDWAWDFLLFAQRNSKPCPVLDVTDPGSYRSVFAHKRRSAHRHSALPDLARWRSCCGSSRCPGHLVEHPDLVTFLIGCSFTFETPLQHAGNPGASHHARLQCADVSDQPSLPSRRSLTWTDCRFDASHSCQSNC